MVTIFNFEDADTIMRRSMVHNYFLGLHEEARPDLYLMLQKASEIRAVFTRDSALPPPILRDLYKKKLKDLDELIQRAELIIQASRKKPMCKIAIGYETMLQDKKVFIRAINKMRRKSKKYNERLYRR